MKRMSFLKEKQGFTLIELLCVVAVMGVIMLPLAGTFSSGYKVFHKEDENIKAMRLARGAMEKIVDMTRKAELSQIDAGPHNQNSNKVEVNTIKIDDNTISTDNEELFAPELSKDFEKVELKILLSFENIVDEPAEAGGNPEIIGKELESIKYTISVKGKRINDYEISTMVNLRKD